MSVSLRLHRALATGAVLLLTACDSLQPPPIPEPARLEIAAGNQQRAPSRATLPEPISVRVTTASGQPVAGQPVFFEVVRGGGTLSSPTARTNANGVAQVQWTLGAFSRGVQEVRAWARSLVSGATLPAVTFSASFQTEPAAALIKLAGDFQTGSAGGMLRDSMAVRVLDARGQPVEGATVRWSVTSGAGQVAPNVSATDSTGLAWARWMLGSTSVQNRVSATVDGLSPVVFTATAAIGSSVKLGDQQTGVVGRALSDSVGVLVLFPNGMPAADVPVVFSVSSQGGSVSPAITQTNSAGVARAAWVMGTATGARTLTATVNGRDPITFAATATADAPTSITVVGGSGQSAQAESALPNPLVVQVTDRFGNPVGGRTVSWTTTSGTITSSSVTGPDGQATARWTLGTALGGVTATAIVAGTGGSLAVEFSATSVIPLTSGLTKVNDVQTGTPGGTVSPSVRLTFPSGAAIAGRTVNWAVTSGGGTVSAAASTTDASGVASITWTLGATPGTNTLVASVTGVQTTATFTVTTTSP